MKEIRTAPFHQINFGHGKTPEEAIVEIIEKQPVFRPPRSNRDLDEKPRFMHTDASFLHEHNLSDGLQEQGVTVTIDRQSIRGSYVLVWLEDISLNVDRGAAGERAEVEFRASIIIPEMVLLGEELPPRGVYHWKAKRISTILKNKSNRLI